MVKFFAIIIAVMAIGTSCTTIAARNLNIATRKSADASFAFENAVRDFTSSVSNFNSAVFMFEIATRKLAEANTSSDAIKARDEAFHASRTARLAQKAASLAYDVSSQAYDESIRSGIEFRRAQQELIVSPDPWESNTSIRNNAIRANNISVDIHNSALAQYQASERNYLDIFEKYNNISSSHLNALQTHNLPSMPDDLFAVFCVIIDEIGEENALEFMTKYFDDFVDAFYELSNE